MKINTLSILLVTGGLFVLSFVAQRVAPEATEKEHKIVFHLSTGDTLAYRALTKQLKNVREHWPDAQIEVVAHNKGVAMLMHEKSNVGPEVQSAMQNKVAFVVCEQTMKNMHIGKKDIMPNVGFVERGLVEIVEKQEAGWAYIKAGF